MSSRRDGSRRARRRATPRRLGSGSPTPACCSSSPHRGRCESPRVARCRPLTPSLRASPLRTPPAVEPSSSARAARTSRRHEARRRGAARRGRRGQGTRTTPRHQERRGVRIDNALASGPRARDPSSPEAGGVRRSGRQPRRLTPSVNALTSRMRPKSGPRSHSARSRRPTRPRKGGKSRPFLESPLPDSNRRPLPYHGSALPTELRGREPQNCLQNRRFCRRLSADAHRTSRISRTPRARRACTP